jgi:Ca-activated chloride channel family protein
MEALSRERGRRVVLVLTDGADACSLRRCADFGDAEKRAVREGFMVYAIGMERPGLAGQIVGLAEDTGGGHFELAAEDDLTSTFMRVAEELRRQYLIGFAPASLDGKLHRLEVRVRHKGMSVRARKNYLAQAPR